MPSSHYETLGVPRNASHQDIVRAYRRLALQHHPDKNGTGDHAKFQSIKEAYEVLGNSIKREAYNLTAGGWTDTQSSHIDAYCNRMLNAMLGYLWVLMKQIMEERVQNVVITLSIDLEDVYHHRVKKLNVRVKRWLEDGTYGDHTVTLYVSLLNFDTEHRFSKMGDDGRLNRKRRSDIIVKLDIKLHPHIKMDTMSICPYDIYIEQKITLYDYYYNTSFTKDVFGSNICVDYSPGQTVAIAKGKGLPFCEGTTPCVKRGDLLVHFELVLPNTLPSVARTVLLDLFHDDPETNPE